MDTGASEEIKQYVETSERLIAALDRLQPMVSSGSGNSTIQVVAGGAGIWICVVACIFTFILSIITTVTLGFYIVDTNTKEARMQDYLNEIYMAAPQLKPKEVR
jgi:hypothetical protein